MSAVTGPGLFLVAIFLFVIGVLYITGLVTKIVPLRYVEMSSVIIFINFLISAK